MSNAEGFILEKESFPNLISLLMKEADEVYGPKEVNAGVYDFRKINKPEEVRLGEVTTVTPPLKKVVRPPFEVLFKFKGEEIEVDYDSKIRAIVGVHPCDVNGLKLLDKAYSNAGKDPYYFSRRSNLIIVAENCTRADDNCFCTSFDTGPELREGYDLLMTDIGNRYLVEVGSVNGEKLVTKLNLPHAKDEDLKEKNTRINLVKGTIRKKLNKVNLKRTMEGSLYHPIWKELGEKCLSCGICSVVCPTCFCFEMDDKLNLDQKSGARYRNWDSCMFFEYSEVALGGNFRRARSARIRQFINHKLNYWVDQFGTFGCVGCGRCIRQCPANIDIVEVARRIGGS